MTAPTPADAAPYRAETDGVIVSVETEFMDDRSQPVAGRYLWAYTVRIENARADAVRLKARFWRITDARGGVQEVRGDGVVGEQPVIHPGAAYEYTSGAPLSTPSGWMSGSYEMETADGARFDAAIPAFSLDSPYETRAPN